MSRPADAPQRVPDARVVRVGSFDVRSIVTGSPQPPPPRDGSYAAVTTPAGLAVACSRCGATLSPGATACPRCGGPVTTINPVEQGERIRLRLQESIGDSYRLVELLGRGGMGIVFRAHEAALDREVALKVLALDPILSPEAYARFEREAKLAARLDHPNVVPIFAVGQRNTVAFYTMRLVRGGTLEDMIDDHKALDYAHAVEILRDVARALDYAHGQGVVHRDIKPANVLIGESGHAMVSDFGIARGLGGDSGFAGTSAVIGSPGYMSPEQWRGEEIDARADQYSLGVMAFELLTGHRPFETVKVQDLMRLHLSADVPSASSIVASLPPYVDLSIKRAMSKSSSARFTSATAFIDALAGKRPVGGVTRTSISVVPNLGEEPRRSSGTGAKAFAALVLIAVTIGAVVMAKSRTITIVPKVPAVAPVPDNTPPLPDSTLNVDTTFNLDSAAHAQNGPVGARQPVAIDPALLLSHSGSPEASGVPHGYIRVVAHGGAAKVRVDGRTFGFSPLVVRVEPGPHIVSLESSGDAFLPSQINITVSDRDTMLAVFTARLARSYPSNVFPSGSRPSPGQGTDSGASQPDSSGQGATGSSLPSPIQPETVPKTP